MQKSTWMTLGGLLGGIALLLATAAAAARAAEPAEKPRPHGGPVHVERGMERGMEMPKPSDYWIGLLCFPADDALRAQLGLEKDRGLVVERVVPDSPAAKAGIQVNDVVVSAGDQLLGKVQDMVDAVDWAKESKLAIELYRGGKTQKFDVTPAKRPEDMGRPEPGSKASEYGDALRKYLEQFRPGEGGPPMRFRFFHSGTVLPPGSRPFAGPLPGDMTVTVTKHGDEPARIKVERGDQKWEVTADKLDELPEDVRMPVLHMLGRPDHVPDDQAGPPNFDFDFFPDWAWHGAPPEGQAPPKLHPEGPVDRRIEEMQRRQEELRKQLDEFRQKLDELRENRPRLREPDKDQKQQGV